MGKIIVKRSIDISFLLCLIYALISFGLMLLIGSLKYVFYDYMYSNFTFTFSIFIESLGDRDSLFVSIGTLISFFIGEIVEYINNKSNSWRIELDNWNAFMHKVKIKKSGKGLYDYDLYPISLFPDIHVGQDRHGYFSCVASGSISIGSNICGKKVCIIFRFDKANKPSINILTIYTASSGLSVECSGIGSWKADGIFYCIDIFRAKPKLLFCSLVKSSTCSIGDISKEDSIQ